MEQTELVMQWEQGIIWLLSMSCKLALVNQVPKGHKGIWNHYANIWLFIYGISYIKNMYLIMTIGW